MRLFKRETESGRQRGKEGGRERKVKEEDNLLTCKGTQNFGKILFLYYHSLD